MYAAVEQISVPIRGVAGPNDAASFFADQHHETNGVSTVSTIKQRIFQLERVIRRPMLPGPVRIAVKSDLRLLTEWVQQYSIDCNMAHEVSNALRNAQLMIDAESTFLLVVDGEPVSMVTAKGTTPHGIRISYVYTPAQHRGRGYASAVVADVSQRQLDSGRKFCFLYTDLANPTSNSIYRKIGYYPVSDAVYHTFVSTI